MAPSRLLSILWVSLTAFSSVLGLRIATYDVNLRFGIDAELVQALATGNDAQASALAQVLQIVRPDVLLLNKFKYIPELDASGNSRTERLFQELYLNVSQNGADPLYYPYTLSYPTSNLIIDAFPISWLVLSQYPIDMASIRTFSTFLWTDMPGAFGPVVSLRLAELFADVPIQLPDDKVVNFLVDDPLPPITIARELKNQTHDQVRFIKDYINGQTYMYDDDGQMGGLPPDTSFVIAGDLNVELFDGTNVPGAAEQLLDDPLINTELTPSSTGAVVQAQLQGGANENHQGNPAYDTADFGGRFNPDQEPGN